MANISLKMSENKINIKNFSLSVTIGSLDSLSQLKGEYFDKIFIGNPFCVKIKNSVLNSAQLLKKELEKYPALEKIILNLPVSPLDEEMGHIEGLLQEAINSGIRAVSVNNFGAAYWIKKSFPEFKLYFDTFANVYTLKDAILMQELGAKAGLLATEISLEERVSILKGTKMEIITPVMGYFPIAFSRYCFFSSRNQDNCLNSCNLDHIISFNRFGSVKQKGRALFSNKSLSLLEHLPLLLSSGLSSFRIEGLLMAASAINASAEIFRKAVNSGFDSLDAGRLKNIFPEGLCNGYFFSKSGQEYL